MKSSNSAKLLQQIRTRVIDNAGRCVLCGMCSTSCPTYQIAKDENESPRGRIALLQGVARQQLTPTRDLITHVDNCLGCRTCEAVCPSLVSYGEILSSGKYLVHQPSNSARRTILRRITRSRAVQSFFAKSVWLTQALGLRFLSRASGLLRIIGLQRWESYLPELSFYTRWDEFYPAHMTEKGHIGLFTGCVTNMLDRQTYASAIRVLNRAGFSVHIPRDQTCCGALPLNNGLLDDAQSCMPINVAAFSRTRLNAVLYASSGCGTTLKETEKWYSGETQNDAQQIKRFSSRVQSLTDFLSDQHFYSDFNIQPLYKKVLIHTPCLNRNILKNGDSTETLLKNIPGIKLEKLQMKTACCGAGGLHVLSHPKMAEQIRSPTIDAIIDSNADCVVSTNFNCARHLAAGLQQAGSVIRVIHPVVLFNEQLR